MFQRKTRVSENDVGRYECTAMSEAGQASAFYDVLLQGKFDCDSYSGDEFIFTP